LWAAAVQKAGSIKRDDVIKVLEGGLSIEGPSGKVMIDPQTHHASVDVHVMEIRGQKLQVKQSFAQRPPRETQAMCDLGKNPNSNTQFEIKL
jgi:branched-chain amino acid transport system substrate-binding protein